MNSEPGRTADFLRWLCLLIALLVGAPQPQSLSVSELAAFDSPATNSESYEETLAAIRQKKIMLLRQYEDAGTDSTRNAVLQRAGEQFVQVVANEVAPFWYGTPWDFNGTTEVPGSGTIACGYFVTTVLRDVGVVLERVKLAQEPSEILIRNLVSPKSIKRFSDVHIEEFLADIREWGKGLYIVGLDVHVGFVVFDDMGIRFIHSSYMKPVCVVQENADESVILAGSRYRVLGKLSADQYFVLAWLKGVHRASM